MMSNSSSLNTLPFGLLELDKAGVIIRYSPALETNPEVPAKEILGRDFFREVAPVAEVKEFQSRFHAFTAGGQSVDKFTCAFPSAQGQIKVQIMLARVSEKSDHGREFLALVRLMPEDFHAAARDGNQQRSEQWK